MNNDLIGKLARLPNDELVTIESVLDGYATVRRVEGKRRGTVAVCKVDSLESSLESIAHPLEE